MPRIKFILKWTLVAVAASALLGALVLYLEHHKVVTRGEFLGLKIGETKEEVFYRLVEIENVTGVSPRVMEDLVIDRDNIGDLSKLAAHEAFIVKAHRTSVEVHVTDGKISKIRPSYAGWQMETVKVGDPLDSALSAVENFLSQTPEAHVFATIKNRGNVWVKEGVSVVGNPDYDRLVKFDRWFFFENNRPTGIDLYFEDNRLEKIDYRNWFYD